MKPFENEPTLELRRAPNRAAWLGPLRALDARLPIQVPLIVGESRGSTRFADDQRHLDRQARIERAQGPQPRGAVRRAPQLQCGLVLERLHRFSGDLSAL